MTHTNPLDPRTILLVGLPVAHAMRLVQALTTEADCLSRPGTVAEVTPNTVVVTTRAEAAAPWTAVSFRNTWRCCGFHALSTPVLKHGRPKGSPF